MSLTPIETASYPLDVDLRYATDRNVLNRPFYDSDQAWLHIDAAKVLRTAAELTRAAGYRLILLDAYRPAKAQEILWNAFPDPTFVADPKRGSNHTRGTAADVTLGDPAGHELDCGTEFDAFIPAAMHGTTTLSEVQLQNRSLLCGFMAGAGFEPNPKEWWHFQLPLSETYPLIPEWAG